MTEFISRPYVASSDDHRVLPNITIGDIGEVTFLSYALRRPVVFTHVILGPKAMRGYESVDNGYARFDHVRIPREHMLSRWAQVTNQGEYVRPPHAKMSYGGVRLFSPSSRTSDPCCTC